MNPTPPPLHIYVHWPWCTSKCPYCDFNSHALPNSPDNAQHALFASYIDRIIADILLWKAHVTPHRPLVSVFFGGGTPSLMKPSDIQRILEALGQLGDWQADTEVTVECNPSSLGEDAGKTFFHDLAHAGVTRVSLGIQGLQDAWLQFLGRRHSRDQALRTLDQAQHAFARVNADVIYGLPGQDLDVWVNQLETLAGRDLSHLSAYQLTIEPNTAFYGQVRRGVWHPLDGDAEADFFDATALTLTSRGYDNYEISNFCRAEQACRHNLGVWRGDDYVGLGAGAHGRLTLATGETVLTAMKRQPDAYALGPNPLRQRAATWETPSATRRIQDALFSGLRLREGIRVDRLVKTHGEDAWKSAFDPSALDTLLQRGLLAQSGTSLHTTPYGWPRLSGILRHLLPRLSAHTHPLSTPSTDVSTQVRIVSDA